MFNLILWWNVYCMFWTRLKSPIIAKCSQMRQEIIGIEK